MQRSSYGSRSPRTRLTVKFHRGIVLAIVASALLWTGVVLLVRLL